MTIDEAHDMADNIERHQCLHVELIFNACGMLRELGIEPPIFSMHARAWLMLITHDGENGKDVCGAGYPYNTSAEKRALNRIEDALILACWNAMVRHGMHGAQVFADDTEFQYSDWRCPTHESGERGVA